MIRIQWFRTLRGAAYLLAVALCVAGMSRPAAAQEVTQDITIDWDGGEVEGISDMIISSDQSEVDTYSETFISYDLLWNWYGAYVEAYLYDGSQLIDGDAEWDDGTGDAVAYLSDPATVGNTYELDSEHYIYWEGDCDPDFPDECDLYDVLSTSVSEEDGGAPYIYSISPNSAAVGTSGSISVNGDNLVDPSECSDSVSFTGTGVTFTVVNTLINGACQQEEDALTINYTIDLTASTGNQTLKLSTDLGTSNGVTFTIYDPTPAIASISPNLWQAGWTNFPVTITGTGFGTSPTVSVGDPNAVCTMTGAVDPGSPNPAQIFLNCSVSSSDKSTIATVTVTSTGYGISFAPAPTGNLAEYNVGIIPTQGSGSQPTAPQIYQVSQPPNSQGDGICGNATNITNSQQQVLVGQQIAFTGCIPTVQLAQQALTQYWTMPDNWNTNALGAPQAAAVGGWSVTNPSSTCVPNPPSQYCNYVASLTTVSTMAPACVRLQSCDFYTFYFVVPGTYTFTYTYGTSVGSASSSVTYVVTGPTNASVTPTQFDAVTEYADQTKNGEPSMGLGDVPGFLGLTLQATFNPPANYTYNANSTSFVHVITQDRERDLTVAGTWTGHKTGSISPTGVIFSQVLDNYYPYISGPQFYDDPHGALPDTNDVNGELSRNFSATLYLMWDPALPHGCQPAANPGNSPTPSTCTSIPVPLGTISWGFCGDAINTLIPQGIWTNWTLSCSSETQPSFIPGTTYPSWQSTNYNSELIQFAQP